MIQAPKNCQSCQKSMLLTVLHKQSFVQTFSSKSVNSRLNIAREIKVISICLLFIDINYLILYNLYIIFAIFPVPGKFQIYSNKKIETNPNKLLKKNLFGSVIEYIFCRFSPLSKHKLNWCIHSIIKKTRVFVLTVFLRYLT